MLQAIHIDSPQQSKGSAVYQGCVPDRVSWWIPDLGHDTSCEDYDDERRSHESPANLPVEAWSTAGHILNIVAEPEKKIISK